MFLTIYIYYSDSLLMFMMKVLLMWSSMMVYMTMFSKNVKIMVFNFSSICFIMCFIMIFMYSISAGGDYWIMMGSYFGVDSCSYVMVFMTIWIMGLMYLSLSGEESGSGGVSWFTYSFVYSLKILVFGITLVILLMFFMSYNFMLMYLFFEISLIPTFLIIYMWGKSLERLEAAFFLLLYMMFISFPLVAFIMKIYFISGSLDLNILSFFSSYNMYLYVMGGWDFFILFMAFFIKLPIYLFHIWLPKAHVEAPVYGSMLLAAVLLKLGGYGLMRLTLMFVMYCNLMSGVVISIGLVGVLYVSFLCLIQSDMKNLVAYSSVVHMNFMMCSLFTLMKGGFVSALVVMITHGLCSSGLFYMVNIFYKYSGSRLIIMNKGYMNVLPSLGIWWFLLCSSNFAFPFSLNFLGEVLMIMVLLGWSMEVIMILGLIAFLSGAYSLYLFSSVFHGSTFFLFKMQGGLLIDHMGSFLHYGPLLVLLINMIVFTF